MARIYAYRANYCPPSATTSVSTGPGGIHTIIASGNTTAQITLYDNTAGSGNVLFSFFVSAYSPVILNLKDVGPIRFVTGLTVVCPAGSSCFVVTEQ
jgi:hypothetical protein